jgi:hypothetical protein
MTGSRTFYRMRNNDRKINATRDCACANSDLVRATLICVWIAVAGISAPVGAQSRDDYCGAGLPRVLTQPIDQARTGRYVNQTYGYSLAIPPGLQAYVAADGPERGFSILLSTEPLAFVRVDASYDVFYDITPAGVHQRDLSAIRLHDAVLEDSSLDAALAQEPARRSRMQLRCTAGNLLRAHEEIIALRRREIYRLDLQTTPERLGFDSRVLDALLRSWRWEPVAGPGR